LRNFVLFSAVLVMFTTSLNAQLASPGADVPVQAMALENRVQPNAAERVAPALGLPTGIKWAPLTPSAGQGPDLTSMEATHPRDEKSGESAFMSTSQVSGRRKDTTRDRVGLILLGLAVHAAVTWDAQSTNHFFSHCPSGYKPTEDDPLMRPFAGKAAMYPMANLLFAVPFDLLLYRARHGRKLGRLLTEVPAGTWTGVEIQQSVMNIRHEHISAR